VARRPTGARTSDKAKQRARSRMRSWPVVAALITAAGAVVAAFITGGFGLLSPRTPTTSLDSVAQGDSSVIVAGPAQNITINQYPASESPTRNAIKALEARLDAAGQELTLQRSDIESIAQALKDLDERTSGIEKLPDGRTRIGNIVTGTPSVVLDEHAAAVELYEAGQYQDALRHSEAAIAALEVATPPDMLMASGTLSPGNQAKIYYLAALAAQRLHLNDRALAWAEKAASLSRGAQTLGLYAAALANVGRRTDAVEVVTSALREFPGDPALTYVESQLGGTQ